MSRHLLTLSTLVLLAVAAFAPAASAEEHSAGKDDCFFLRDMEGWKSPSPNIIYFRVSPNHVYRFDLADKTPQLSDPDARIDNRPDIESWVCSPQDLYLTLRMRHEPAFAEHLFVKSITRLSPAEVAAIPSKFQP